jgi:SAM-dependent methyltransferase
LSKGSTANHAGNRPDSYVRKLELFEHLRRTLVLEALDCLSLPKSSHGLDAGCGTGLHLEPLLNAVSPGGCVTGLDLSPELLSHASTLVEKKCLAGPVQLIQGDIRNLPCGPEIFDWIWSVDCAGYIRGDKAALVAELARVLTPGGRLALMAYSSQQLLPGYSGLEARLNATETGQLPFNSTDAPEDHFMRLPDLFKQAGLANIKSRTLLAQFSSPFDSKTRDALLELMEMRWGAAHDEVDASDWAMFNRLSQPDSEDCILDRPGYHGFFNYTMFTGVKPA